MSTFAPAARHVSIRLAAFVAALAGAASALAQPAMQPICYWGEDAQGVRAPGRTMLPLLPRPVWPTDVIPAPVTPIYGSAVDGVSTNRYNIVVVGDGYQAAQLGTYATHAASTTNYLLTQEPFKTYASYFNVFRVDVTSVDSGVDNDPTQGILRNTALDMAFWCNNTERLLCVNTTKAFQFANNAPQLPDQVLALANSTKYGGAGYPSANLGTSSGGNGSAPEIVVHELGHSMGDLADEYDYGGPTAYVGGEPAAANSSIYNAAAQTAQLRKWYRWIGENNAAFDGLVSSYEGSSYSVTGIFRPTNNSKMRALGRPFNLPSAEALIVELYRKVRPIESSTSNAATLTGTPTISLQLLQPVNNPLQVTWAIDGVTIPGQSGPNLDLAAISAPAGLRTITATVVDTTFMVRDPVARAQWLTQTRSWTWNNAGGTCYANCDNSTVAPVLNAGDFGCFLTRFRESALLPASAQITSYGNCDGSNLPPVLNAGDFTCFLNRFRAGCP